MTTVSGADLDERTEVSRSLAVLPALVGLLATATLVVGAVLGDVIAGPLQSTLVWVGALLVLGSMLTGFVVNHYLGLLLFVIAAASTPGEKSSTFAATAVITFWLCHEFGRFSLDARLPSRFGPGYLTRFAFRSAAVLVVCLVAVLVAPTVEAMRAPPMLWPVGFVLAALPLLLRRAMMTVPRSWRAPVTARAAVGLAVAVLALGGGLLGVTAQSEIAERIPDERPVTQEEVVAEETTGVSPQAETPEATQSPTVRFFVIAVTTLAALLLAGLVFAALRRPEVAYELDDLHLDTDHSTLSLSRPGRADLDDETTLLDERDYAALLDELLLDLTGEPDPARAIRYGYATVERRLRELGVVRASSETEQELLTRALRALGGDSGALVELTSLFEAARFSPDPVSEPMRQQALAAVGALQASITHSGSGPADQPEDEPDDGPADGPEDGLCDETEPGDETRES